MTSAYLCRPTRAQADAAEEIMVTAMVQGYLSGDLATEASLRVALTRRGLDYRIIEMRVDNAIRRAIRRIGGKE